MAITAGMYEIISAISPDFFLGRSPHEDRSLLPKSIVMLPRDGGQSPYPWIVSESDNGTFILKAANAPAANIDGKLQAVLIDSSSFTINWKFTPVPQYGEDAYAISSVESAEIGWTLGVQNSGIEPFQPVLVDRLIVGLSLPPTYPTPQVFIFKRMNVG